MQEREPNVKLTRLFEKKSKTGNQYFTGRLGAAKVVLLKSREVTEDGSVVWDLLVSQAAPYEGKKPAAKPEPASDYDGPDVSNEGPARHDIDDEIPF